MSFKNKLNSYINRWEEKNIINANQKQLILKDIEEESATGNFFKILGVIGALFIGLGILLLISSNWEYLPKFIKLLLILLMPIISTSVGYFLSYVKQEYQKLGDSFIFLGSLLIGASLALLGQLYNLDSSVSGLLMLWTILTIPMTFLFKFRLLSFLTISLFYITMIIHSFDFFDNPNSYMIYYSFLSFFVLAISFSIRRAITKDYSIIFKTFEVVSIKVLLISLFLSTLTEELYFLGGSLISAFIQNFLFLGVVFTIMWFSNKNYNTILRNSTFFWIGLFMINKYFTWLWDYMHIGLFFVLFGGFLMLLVLGYIKGTKYLEEVKQSDVNKIKEK